MNFEARFLRTLGSELRRGLGFLLLAGAFLAPTTNAQAEPDPSDPPARVGRISQVSGPVTLTDFIADEESDATPNWPLTSQQRLSTGRLGRAEVQIGSTSVRLDGDTVLDFVRVDDQAIQLTLHRGSAAIRIRNREVLREIEVLTPRERIAFEDVGRYRIDVDRVPGASAVTAHVGAARVSNDRMNFLVQSGQRGELATEPSLGFHLVAISPDVFDDWVAARDRRDDSLRSTQYVSAETTGVEGLDNYGDWRTVETYGAVWFPSTVAVGWAPYRYGHWAYVSPWGWTWIDDAPWGFTPFHYGRWVYVRGTWGWVPGAYAARPCYAPALVAWYGAAGAGVGIGAGGPIGWFPLGPGEAFIPSYRHTGRYIRSVNLGNVTNVTVINPPPRYRYRQPDYSTWAPREAVVRGAPIHRVVREAPTEWAKLPTTVRAPVKLPNDDRRGRATSVNIVTPGDSARVPPRGITRRDYEPNRVDKPALNAPGGSRDFERRVPSSVPSTQREPKASAPTPAIERVPAPVQRVPRADTRQEGPRRVPPSAGSAPSPRPAKTQPVESAPAQQTGHVGAPAQQFVPRASPAPRQEAPVKAAPAPGAKEPSAENGARHKAPPRPQADVQR